MPFSRQTWLSLTMAALVAGSAGSALAVDPAAGQGTAQPTQPTQSETTQPARPESTQPTQPTQTETVQPAQSGNTQPGTQTSADAPAAAAEVLTEEQAVEQALQSNSELQAFRLDVKTADINARLVKAQTGEIDDDLIESLEAAQAKYIQNATAEMRRKINELSLKAMEGQIKLKAQQAYYDWVNAQAELELRQQSLKRAELQLKVAQAAFDTGTRAKSDVLQAQAGLAASQAQLAAAEMNAKTALLNLNMVMGVDLGENWTTPKGFKVREPQPITLAEAIQQAHSQRVEIVQKDEEKKLAELQYELISKYLAASTYQGQMQKAAVQKAELGREDAERMVTLQVTQAYLRLDAAKAQIEALQKARDAAAESYRLTRLRFENGLATTLEVIQAEEELSNREHQHQKALHDYNLAVVGLANALGN